MTRIKILFLAPNPVDESRLRLDEEVRENKIPNEYKIPSIVICWSSSLFGP
jgi:hypothetical protein